MVENKYQDQYNRCLDFITTLLDNDKDKANIWMNSKQDILFGATPIEVIFAGEGDHLEKWLMSRLGLCEGEGF